MVRKVKDQEDMAWLGESGQSFSRDSMNKSAMDSFTKILVAQARKLHGEGVSIADIAEKYQLEPQFVLVLLNEDERGETKMACACDEEVKLAEGELTPEEQAALDAYNTLHKKSTAAAPKLDVRNSRTILTGKGDVSDGGGHRHMGSQSQNSIWDSEVISRAAEKMGVDERLKAEREAHAKKRAEAKQVSRYHTIDGESIEAALKEIDLRKDAGIRSAGATEAHKYNNKLPMNGISIFDTEDFQRAPEQTAGEKRREEIKKEAAAPKDRSWVDRGGRQVKSGDFLKNMIDSINFGEGK